MKDFMRDGPLEVKDASGGDNKDDKRPDTGEIKQLIETFSTTLEAFMKKTDQEIAEIKDKGGADPLTTEAGKKMSDELTETKKMVEQLRLENNRPVITAPDGTKQAMTEDQIEHKKAFESYFRKGDEGNLAELETKTLSVGTDPDGGYTVPTQMEGTIDRVITEISPIRQIARVVQVSTAEYRRMTSQGGATSGWVGEQTSRPTTATPTLAAQKYPVHEIYAMPAATQSILDDSSISIEQWLADEVSIEFAQQEGAAFINGNSSSQPQGFLQGDIVDESSWAWGKTGRVKTGAAGAFLTTSAGDQATNFTDLVYSLKPAFRGNARFVMNRATVSEVMKFRDADGRPLWHSGLQEGQPDVIHGYPITEAEDMPDIANGSYSVAFGDFRRGYLIVDRIGTRVLRDPYSSKPYILFYTTRRVGAGLAHYDAIKLLQFAT